MNERITYIVTNKYLPTVWAIDARTASEAIAHAKYAVRITGISMRGKTHAWQAKPEVKR